MRKKRIWIFLLAAVLGLAAAGVGLYRYRGSHVFLDGRVYSKNAERLDLRGLEISPAHYDALREALPDCEILWDVPFQGARYSQDTRSLTVASLSHEDLAALDYLPMLEALSAEGCEDYSRLAELKQLRPELAVSYTVPVDGRLCPQDTRSVTLRNLTDEQITLLQYLPELETVHAEDCADLPRLKKLREAYPGVRVYYRVPIGGALYPEGTEELTLTGASLEELERQLPYLPELQAVTLYDPVGSADILRALPDTYPDISFHWEMDVFGVTVTSDDREFDLSGYPLSSPEPVKAAMAYFPNMEKVILCKCGIDNETMAAFREEMRGQYKVVWSVAVGYMTLRTDETCYMPGKHNRGVNTEQAYNLRYCEDLICIDVGHKPVKDCAWAAYMPNLKYLIIADTGVSDLTPLTGLEHLIYLEAFLTRVTDYSPLLTCTAMEDLNICYTYGDPEPVKQMTWLKRLWWADSPIPVSEFQQYLPDTQLMFLHHSSTGNGWRRGQNYYDMRDLLGVPYMGG